MPISVPPGFKKELEEAVKWIKGGGYGAIGGLTVNEIYKGIKQHLNSNNVPYEQHDSRDDVPAHKPWYDPNG